jgi:hypothetical protein
LCFKHLMTQIVESFYRQVCENIFGEREHTDDTNGPSDVRRPLIRALLRSTRALSLFCLIGRVVGVSVCIST